MALVKKLPLSVDQIVLVNAAAIAQKLSDPRSPKICPLCVYDFIIPFAIQHVTLLSKKCHAFWDAIVAFVAIQRSDVEIASLERSLTTLQKVCPSHRTITKPYNTLGQSLAQITLDTMMRAIFNALNPEPTAESSMKRAHSERRSFGDTSGNWPQAPIQLLPYGTEASLRAYVCWATDPLLPWALLTISSLNVTVYPLVLPVLVGNPVMKSALAHAIIRPISNSQIIMNLRESAPNGISPNPDRTAWDGAFGVLTGLHLDPYSTPAIRHAFVGDGVAEILFPALYNFLARGDSVPGDRILIARHWLSVTYQALPAGPLRSAIPIEFHMGFAADRQRMIDQTTVTDL